MSGPSSPPTVRRDYMWLGIILMAGLGLRLWAILAYVIGGVLADPDGYVQLATTISDGIRDWHWTWDAVTFREFFKAPLYQTAVSVLTANLLPVVGWGLTTHALLNSCSILALYFIGRALHTTRAGLIAAAIYAMWVPNINLTMTFWQEHLYVPLLLVAFALLAAAVERPGRQARWIAAGVIFGAAALTRSSVVYYLPLAAAWLWLSPGRRTIRRGLAAFVAAVLVVTVPYAIALSRHAGRFVPIEDIGSFGLKVYHPVSPVDASITLDRFAPDASVAPTGLETARFLMADFIANPRAFVERRMDMVRLLLKPAGGSTLEASITPDRTAARWLTLSTHATLDLPFVLVLALCPVGFAISRQRVVAGLLLIWILSICFLLALTMWAGLRFRAPIEPAMIVLASVALAGAWVRPTLATACIAVVVFAGAGATLITNAGSLLRGRPSYGVSAWPPAPGTVVTFTGAAGLRTGSAGRNIQLYVEARDPEDTQLTVAMDGRVVDVVSLSSGTSRILTYHGLPAADPYLELVVRTATGRPGAIALGLR